MKQFLTDDQKEKFTKVVIKEDIMDETVGFGAEMYRKGYVDCIVHILIGAACAGYILKRHLDKKKQKNVPTLMKRSPNKGSLFCLF